MKKILIFSIIIILISCHDFYHNGKITNAKVIEFKNGRGEEKYLKYEYYVNKVRYSGEKTLWISGRYIKRYIGKYFPVLYLKDKPNYSRLLVTRYSFESNNLSFPDSLRWTEICN